MLDLSSRAEISFIHTVENRF